MVVVVMVGVISAVAAGVVVATGLFASVLSTVSTTARVDVTVALVVTTSFVKMVVSVSRSVADSPAVPVIVGEPSRAGAIGGGS